MTDRIFLFLLIACGIICGAEVFVIVTTIPPATANLQAYWIFFSCLFGALTSLLCLLWHPIKTAIHRRATLSRWVSFRQAALVSLVLVLLLFFKSVQILTIWDSLPLALSVILVEFFFEADKTPLHDKH